MLSVIFINNTVLISRLDCCVTINRHIKWVLCALFLRGITMLYVILSCL